MEGLDLYLETDDGGRRCGEEEEEGEEGEEIDVELEMEVEVEECWKWERSTRKAVSVKL